MNLLSGGPLGWIQGKEALLGVLQGPGETLDNYGCGQGKKAKGRPSLNEAQRVGIAINNPFVGLKTGENPENEAGDG